MLDALVRADPAHEKDYRANFAKFAQDLDSLHAQLTQAFAPVRGRKLFVYHPAFGYLADAYGFEQVPMEIEGKEPAPRDLAHYIQAARQYHVRVIFVQPQFSQKSARLWRRPSAGS